MRNYLAICLLVFTICNLSAVPIQSQESPDLSSGNSEIIESTPTQSTPGAAPTGAHAPTPPTQSNSELGTQEVPVSNYSNSVVEIGDCICLIRETSVCTSLGDAIFTTFSELSMDQDSPYSFFTLRDLYYSEILDNQGVGTLQPPPLKGVDYTSESEVELTQHRCMDLMARYDFPTKDSEGCKWNYECTQNQLHFPSFSIEAKLEEGSPRMCTAISMENKRFIRTQCRLNEDLPHWLECSCERLVTGFELES